MTAAVHDKGGRIFIQIVHVGRMSHPDNTPHHRQGVSSSAIAPGTQMFTATGIQDIPTPRTLSFDEVRKPVADFRHAAWCAIDAGADGVEIHGAALSSSNSSHQTRTRRVLEYLDANFKNDITLENIAGISGYSVFHFARKFTLDEKRGCVVSRSGQQERSKQAQAGKRRGPLPHACLLIHSVQ